MTKPMLALAVVALLAACSPKGGGGGPAIFGGGDRLPSDALDDAIGRAVGDPPPAF